MAAQKKPASKEPMPKQPTSKQPTSKQSVTKQPTPKPPKQPTPKQPTPKQPTPKQPTPKQPTPKQPTPKQPTPKQPTPKQPTPKQPTVPTPKQAAPKQLAPKLSTPKQPVKKLPVTKQPVTKQPVTKQFVTKRPVTKQPTPQQARPIPSVRGINTGTPKRFDPLDYMTAEELLTIDTQFATALEGVDVLLFWTGVAWDHVQRWAKTWNLKTLTIAMGPLMDPQNPDSPKARKSAKAYKWYVKGASGRFAQYARQHCRVVVLTNPPPNIYSSRENNTYQYLEEPILKGLFGDSPVRRIDYLHPTVVGAAHVTYQAWPCDKTQDWGTPFGGRLVKNWKRLNWSYKSLVTTSQLGLRPLQKPLLPSDSTLHLPLAQSIGQQDEIAVNHPSDVGSLSSKPPLNEGNVDHATAEKDRPREGPDIRDDVNKIPLLPVKPEPGINSHHHDMQLCRRVRRFDFHEEDSSVAEPDHPPTPAYTIERCRTPTPPTMIPVISIDDIMVGAEASIDIDEYGANKDFLYLTMKCVSGLGRWWRLRWVG